VDVEGQLTTTALRLESEFDPGADPLGLSATLILGAVSFTAVLAAQKQEPDEEGADGADRGEDIGEGSEPVTIQGEGPRAR
jgi:hypothetical protein